MCCWRTEWYLFFEAVEQIMGKNIFVIFIALWLSYA
jgi:hypothetical protein